MVLMRSFVFVLSKIFELFDTIWLLLKKKDIAFLHWYHHISVFIFCWHSWLTVSPASMILPSMNFSFMDLCMVIML
eukprot:UN01189